MAIMKPFGAYRPAKQYVEDIAALPYDVYDRLEARREVERKPLSFLNIDRPETQFAPDYDMYAPEVYQKAHDMLESQIQQGFYIQDEAKCFYLYELTMDGRTQTGIVACASIDDYQNAVIKKHENTRADKEQDRIRHVKACQAQTGPIFLAYRKNEVLAEIISDVKTDKPEYDFTASDGITHRVWVISDSAKVEKISDIFSGIQEIYIADGHHRCASAVKVGLQLREEHPDYTGDEEFNYFLSVLFADEELMIMDYNRVVKTWNGMNKEAFLEKLSKVCDITKLEAAKKPEQKGQVTMFMEDTWYLMEFKQEVRNQDPVEGLDVSLLQNLVLKPMFGIEDPKTDKNIDFVGGIRGIGELERRVHTDSKVAFCMYPTSIAELFDVADHKLLMPPKSTWFEPKLRSGLFIHKF